MTYIQIPTTHIKSAAHTYILGLKLRFVVANPHVTRNRAFQSLKRKKIKFQVYGTVHQRKPSPEITSLSKAHYKAQALFVIPIFGGLKLILRVIFSFFTFLPKKDKDKNKKPTPTQSAFQTRYLLVTSFVRAQYHSANSSGYCLRLVILEGLEALENSLQKY